MLTVVSGIGTIGIDSTRKYTTYYNITYSAGTKVVYGKGILPIYIRLYPYKMYTVRSLLA